MVKDTVTGKEWGYPLNLDLGPGPWKKEGFVGIDIREFWEGDNPDGTLKVDVDLLHDLNKGIPFPDNSVNEVHAGHFLEHVSNIYFMMDEIYRVMEPTGIVHATVPLYEMSSVDHVTCFYPDWVERNLFLPGARYSDKFFLVYKNVRLQNLESEKRAFWILEFKLRVMK
jgi:predicted SAM-dependent methyltransferase